MIGDTKQKYVRLERFDQIIIFNQLLDHSTFEFLKPISAGFCYIGNNEVTCFGKSTTLKLDSMEDDSKMATKQIFGYDAMLVLEKNNN